MAAAMASSTAHEAQSAAQTQLSSRLSTPGNVCVDGASSTAVPAVHTTLDSCEAATSAGGSQDVQVFSSLSEPSSALAVLGSVSSPPCLETLPGEVLAHIASFLDVDDLLRASRVSALPCRGALTELCPGTLHTHLAKVNNKKRRRRNHFGPSVLIFVVAASSLLGRFPLLTS